MASGVYSQADIIKLTSGTIGGGGSSFDPSILDDYLKNHDDNGFNYTFSGNIYFPNADIFCLAYTDIDREEYYVNGQQIVDVIQSFISKDGNGYIQYLRKNDDEGENLTFKKKIYFPDGEDFVLAYKVDNDQERWVTGKDIVDTIYKMCNYEGEEEEEAEDGEEDGNGGGGGDGNYVSVNDFKKLSEKVDEIEDSVTSISQDMIKYNEDFMKINEEILLMGQNIKSLDENKASASTVVMIEEDLNNIKNDLILKVDESEFDKKLGELKEELLGQINSGTSSTELAEKVANIENNINLLRNTLDFTNDHLNDEMKKPIQPEVEEEEEEENSPLLFSMNNGPQLLAQDDESQNTTTTDNMEIPETTDSFDSVMTNYYKTMKDQFDYLKGGLLVVWSGLTETDKDVMRHDSEINDLYDLIKNNSSDLDIIINMENKIKTLEHKVLNIESDSTFDNIGELTVENLIKAYENRIQILENKCANIEI